MGQPRDPLIYTLASDTPFDIAVSGGRLVGTIQPVSPEEVATWNLTAPRETAKESGWLTEPDGAGRRCRRPSHCAGTGRRSHREGIRGDALDSSILGSRGYCAE